MSIKNTIILIIVLALISVGIFYYVKKPTPAIAPTPEEQTPVVQTPPSTFGDTAFSGFPKELVPVGGITPQYFDNALATGAIFETKKPVAQAESDYEKQLKPTNWSVANKILNTNQSDLFLVNKETSASAQVKINMLLPTVSDIVITIKK